MTTAAGSAAPVQLSLLPDASSVPTARHAIQAWLTQIDREDLTDDAALAVTEVVTNALLHAATRVELRARLDRSTIRIEVADGSSHLPLPRGESSTSGTGRGLSLLDQMATRWGADRRADEDGGGKVVWFEIGEVPASADGSPTDAVSGDRTPGVLVTLLNVPLLLLSAWLEHTSALLREHLLVQLETEDVETVLQQHASAGEALAILQEQWPRPGGGRHPEELLAVSIEPEVTMSRMDLTVPTAAVASFATLDDTIEGALALADSGALLTPPTQPEMRAVRRWLVQEVLEQAAGHPPRPHVFEVWTPAGPPPEMTWDLSPVSEADTARIATDDANRIVAVSDAAVRLLGYQGLLGRRLLTIIPPRFHQAHLAGFSLHLVNGRGPLIGVPIRVPVLCADGAEQTVELLITAHHLGNGRAVYIADLTPV